MSLLDTTAEKATIMSYNWIYADVPWSVLTDIQKYMTSEKKTPNILFYGALSS